ncbi:allergen Tha p 1 [Drosophila sechellia]|uniref:Allergen Tha p 1 n=1 Tax=Drosophila mauritiana TaxID=7226 RepID=A0A6P8JPK8_DROMA|nr:allergen Tha p 1 [Drosophila sechellia]XP_033152916.1 allergen Tha p 1 [Drosophila mauritiana]
MHEYLRDTDTQFLLHIQLYYTVSRSERMLLLNKNRVLSLVVNFIFLIILISSSVQADERNINKLLNNQVVVSRQIMCILGKSECDQLGLQLKAALPEVITRKCRNCSPQQAQKAQKLTTFLQTRYPDVWAMLLRKYDSA